MVKKPEITNYQPVTSSQLKAIGQARRLAQIINNSPVLREQVIKGFLGDKSVRVIVKGLPQILTEQSFGVAVKAVKFVVRENVDPETKEQKVQEHRQLVVDELKKGTFYKDIGRSGYNNREDLTPDNLSIYGKAGARARGQGVWTIEEKDWAFKNRDCFRNIGGFIDYDALAAELNARFHNNKPVRGRNIRNTLHSFEKTMRRK
jgi:hypothetical protein